MILLNSSSIVDYIVQVDGKILKDQKSSETIKRGCLEILAESGVYLFTGLDYKTGILD